MPAPASDKILVFIPTYRCARQIGRVLAQFEDVAVAGYFSEILVLDNGSDDGTLDAAQQAAARLTSISVTIARNNENYNLGGSHKAAFAYAIQHQFTHVVLLHGDDQADIRDALPILGSGSFHAFDCCLGARFMPQSRITGYSIFRLVGNYVFNLIYSLATLRRIPDMGSGLNIYAVDFLRDQFYLPYPDNLHFSCCLLLGALARRGRVTFFPISWREEDQASNVRLFRQAWHTFMLAVGYVFARKRFFAREHRQIIRADYPFSVVYRYGVRP